MHHTFAFLNFIFAIGLLLASFVLQAMATPKTNDTPKRSSLSDFDFPQIDETTPQCVVFGDVWIPDWMILWYGNMRSSPIKSTGQKK